MPKAKLGRPLGASWLTTQAVLSALGISRSHLYRLRDDGLLKQGHHWRNISPKAGRPCYRWNLRKIEAVLNGEG